MRLALSLAALPLLALPLAACGSDEPDAGPPTGEVAVGTGGSASCALAVEVDGVFFIGQGGVKEVPLTDEKLPAEVPACDDTGGTDDDPGTPEPTEVQVIDGVDPSDAVWWADTVMVRQGAEVSQRMLRQLGKQG